MNRWSRTKRYLVLSSAVALWLNAPLVVMADNAAVTTDVVHVQGTWAEEEAKLNPQQVQIITKKRLRRSRRSPSKILYLPKRVFLEPLMPWDVSVYPFAVQRLVIH